jgi:hypothetical protein
MFQSGRSEESPLRVTCECTSQWKWLLGEYENVTKLLAFYQQSQVITTHMWPVMGFSQISHATFQYRGTSEKSDFNQIGFNYSWIIPYWPNYLYVMLEQAEICNIASGWLVVWLWKESSNSDSNKTNNPPLTSNHWTLKRP